MVDKLTKLAHFIATSSTVDAKGFATLHWDHVFRHHGLPDDIISDRGLIFVSSFSRALVQVFSIKINFSTAFHPQTNGQIERINAILEQYLRAYVNYQQDNWTDWLAIAEFAYNNSLSSSTKLTPFFANYGFHPRFEIKKNPSVTSPLPKEVKHLTTNFANLEAFVKTELRYAQVRYAEQANASRLPPPLLRLGDRV